MCPYIHGGSSYGEQRKYAGVSGEMKQLMDTAKGLSFFTEQMDADAHAFKSVMEAYRMPKGQR